LVTRGDLGKAFGQGVGDFLAVRGDPDAGAVDAGAAGVLRDGIGDQVDVLFPVLGAFVGQEDFGVAGAVDFDARIAAPGLGRTDVAEEHAAAGRAQNLAGAGVIGRVVAEDFGG